MNNLLSGKALLIMTLSLSPLMAHAITETQAIDACAQSLAERIELAQGAPLSYSIGEESLQSTRRVRDTASYQLLVKDANSDARVFEADCVVSSNGRVRLLNIVPVLAKNAF